MWDRVSQPAPGDTFSVPLFRTAQLHTSIIQMKFNTFHFFGLNQPTQTFCMDDLIKCQSDMAEKPSKWSQLPNLLFLPLCAKVILGLNKP